MQFRDYGKFNLDSIKHHYIPVFFIKAFTNEEGFLWIYDKEKNVVLKRFKHPSNIFFEDYSNSIEINGQKVPMVELMYSNFGNMKGIDPLLCDSVKELQYSKDDKVTLTTERISHLIYFIAQLTWRIPANEKANKILLEHYSHSDPMLYASMSKVSWLNKEDQFKIARFITPSIIFRENGKIKYNEKIQVKIIDFHSPVFCLSDNPIIWKIFPVGINDFTNPLIFPINKQKAFVVLNQSTYNYTTDDLKLTIMILMHQAKKYVAFHNKKGLQEYVNAYQEYRKIGSNQQSIIKGLFERINK